MRFMIEVRWHGRGGQGIKTASRLLALAQVGEGWWVQAVPEYGPERSGAPMVAYNRADETPIRRHDAITHPTLVVVLDRSLWREQEVWTGLGSGGLVLLNAPEVPVETDWHRDMVMAVPADRLAREAGAGYANVVMVGAVRAVLGRGGESSLTVAVQELFGRRLSAAAMAATERAVMAGYRFVRDAEKAS